MPLSIHLADQSQFPVVYNLLQLYLHETSNYNPRIIDESGLFDVTLWKEGLERADLEARIIRVKGKLAGFAISQARRHAERVAAHTLTELFLLENYRGFGIGEEIARQLFDRYHGLWQIPVDPQNEGAIKFFKAVLYRYTGDNYREISWKGHQDHVFEFHAPGAHVHVENLKTKPRLHPAAEAQST